MDAYRDSVPRPHSHPLQSLRERLRTGLSGSYLIERELGRGGTATVFLAQDLKHHRPVALKVLHHDLATALGPERFRREISFVARLRHHPERTEGPR